MAGKIGTIVEENRFFNTASQIISMAERSWIQMAEVADSVVNNRLDFTSRREAAAVVAQFLRPYSKSLSPNQHTFLSTIISLYQKAQLKYSIYLDSWLYVTTLYAK